MSAILNFLFGEKGRTEKQPTLSPEQQGFQNQLLQLLGQQTGQGGPFQAGSSFLTQLLQGGPEAFSQFEAPFKRQFQEQTIPKLAEQFGGVGAQSSSAFQQALGQAGAGLSEQLAALRSGAQLQALPQAGSYGSAFLSPALASPFVYQQTQPSLGFLGSLLSSLGGGFGQAGGQAFGNRFLGGGR